jgi:C1A family cysteine protease
MNVPRKADLRPHFIEYGLEPRAQGKRGTCSIFAVVGVLEYEFARAGALRRGERLSVEFLNWASHQTNGRKIDGSFFSDALNGVNRFGVCAETLLPYASDFDVALAPPPNSREDALRRREVSARWIKEWDVKTGLTEDHLNAIRESIAEGHPVAVGLRWPKKAQFDRTHRLNHPPPPEVFDGHSIIFVGYADDARQPGGGTFTFRNSSGPEWQDGGYARMTYAYAADYANDAVGMRVGNAR